MIHNSGRSSGGHLPVQRSADYHQKGSIIVIVLMLLVILSVIGISSTNNTVTENFIVRNTAFRKQNHQMVDIVASEALQRAMDAGLIANNSNDDPSDLEEDLVPMNPTSVNWVIDKDIWAATGKRADWYNPDYNAGWVLGNDDEALDPNLDLDAVSERYWEAPSMIRKNSADPTVSDEMLDLLIERGEWADGNAEAASPIRYAMVGWNSAPGSSLKTTSGINRRTAELLAEYVSPNFGVTRLTVGLERNF